jgi:hypothetical protein
VAAIFSKFDRKTLEYMAEAARDGKLVIPISQTLPLSEAAKAQAAAEKAAGKSCWCLKIFVRYATSKGKIEREERSPRIQSCFETKRRRLCGMLASPDGWWFHLRRCAECGHIGCCDNSPSQHASKHAAATGLPVITSFEPGEDWFFDYDKQEMIRGVEFPPHSHPENQSVPGPAERVPANWESLLN